MSAMFTMTELVIIFLFSKGVLALTGAVVVGVTPVRQRVGAWFSSPRTDPGRLLE